MKVYLHSSLSYLARNSPSFMQRTTSSVVWVAQPLFPTLSNKQNNFREKGIEHKTRVSLQIYMKHFSFLILSRIQREMIINYIGLRVKYPLFLSDINQNWILAKSSNTEFHKKSIQLKTSRSMQTEDMSKLIVTFRNYVTASEEPVKMVGVQTEMRDLCLPNMNKKRCSLMRYCVR